MTKDSKRKINRRLCQKITFVQKSRFDSKRLLQTPFLPEDYTSASHTDAPMMSSADCPEFLAMIIEKTFLKIRNNLRNCEPQTLQTNKKPQPQIQIKVP